MNLEQIQQTDVPEATLRALEALNAHTALYGLVLSRGQLLRLEEDRFRALAETGRVEFGDGILQQLILQFADSPYLTRENAERTLSDLQALFYAFKSQSMERLADDLLLRGMKIIFDRKAHGSVDFLEGLFWQQIQRCAEEGDWVEE